MFDELLVHEVEVRRRSGSVDRFGQPTDSNPTKLSAAAVVATYPCRMTRGSRGRANEERSLDVFADQLELFVAPDADIQEDDALKVTDPATGDVLMPLAIVKLKNLVYDGIGPHHLEVHALVQRGPQ